MVRWHSSGTHGIGFGTLMPPINGCTLRWSLVFKYYGDCWQGILALQLGENYQYAMLGGLVFAGNPECGPTVVSASSSSVALRHGYFTPAV